MSGRAKVTRIASEIRAHDPRRAKSGIQAACEFIESGRSDRADRIAVTRALSAQLGSHEPKVLRWGYKLIALLNDPTYVDYLVRQLAHHDFDPENRTWAYSALAALTDDHERLLYRAGDQMMLAYELAGGMFARDPNLRRAVEAAAQTDDPLAHQWVGLVHGARRIRVQDEVVRDLSGSDDPAVVEYSIWGNRLAGGSPLMLDIDPFTIARRPENVRRWYYRSVVEREAIRDVLESEVTKWIDNETNSLAREGLALGLTGSNRDEHWEGLHRAWRASESDPFVRRALGDRDAPSSPGRIPVPGGKASRKGAKIMIINNFTGGTQTIGGIAGRDVHVTLTDPRPVAADLLDGLKRLPSADPAHIEALRELVDSAPTVSEEQRVTFWQRLSSIAGAVKSTADFTTSVSRILDSIDNVAGMLS